MRRERRWWPGVVLLVALMAGGCTGTLWERAYDDGQTERLKIQRGECWSISPGPNPTKQEGSLFLLKKESTF